MVNSDNFEISFGRLANLNLFVPIGARVPMVVGSLHVDPERIETHADKIGQSQGITVTAH